MSQKGTIGIVGGGQLGRMLTEAALALGFKVIVLNPTPNSPAAQGGAEEIVSDLYDAEALRELAERSDYLTVEIEHLDATLLQQLADSGKSVNPSPQTLAMIQDKLEQKQFLRQAGIPVADFAAVNNAQEAGAALDKFDGKMLLKTRFGAYDGRGNALIESAEDLTKALDAFGDQALYTERFVPFVKELAVMVARDSSGKVATYPVTETFHQRNICIETRTPAAISTAITQQAEQVALQAANHLEGAGVFGIELFLTDDEQILINEIAPRVHNSGHYTIEACQTSQFEQHIRAITGLELGSTELKAPAAVMLNILGYRQGAAMPGGINAAEADGHTKVHMYGKAESKFDRKMGHLTSIGDTVEEARQYAEAASEHISI